MESKPEEVKEKVLRVKLIYVSKTKVKEEVRPDGRTDASASSEATVTVIHLFKL